MILTTSANMPPENEPEDLFIRLGITAELLLQRGLIPYPEASTLCEISAGCPDNPGLRRFHLAPDAATAWERLHAAALEDGIALAVISAYRSVARQCELIEAKLAAGLSPTAILSVLAPPGYSEHHTGCALDLGIVGSPPLLQGFADTPAFAWLMQHAGHFGFVLSYPPDNASGYQYEPWHWCYQPALTKASSLC